MSTTFGNRQTELLRWSTVHNLSASGWSWAEGVWVLDCTYGRKLSCNLLWVSDFHKEDLLSWKNKQCSTTQLLLSVVLISAKMLALYLRNVNFQGLTCWSLWMYLWWGGSGGGHVCGDQHGSYQKWRLCVCRCRTVWMRKHFKGNSVCSAADRHFITQSCTFVRN